jgi:hypothetical protein
MAHLRGVHALTLEGAKAMAVAVAAAASPRSRGTS